MPKGEEKTNASRKRIEDAVLRLLEDRPITKITMGQVADEAGVSRGTLYNYYGNAYEILCAAARVFYVGMNAEHRRLYTEDLSPEDLYDLLYVDYEERAHVIRENPHLYANYCYCQDLLEGTPEFKVSEKEFEEFWLRVSSLLNGYTARSTTLALPYMACCMRATTRAICLKWLEGGCAESDAEVARMAAGAVFALGGCRQEAPQEHGRPLA
jgi:AcrR family transcriptional regulator